MTKQQFQALDKSHKLLTKAFSDCHRFDDDQIVWSCTVCPLKLSDGTCLKGQLGALCFP